MCRLPYIDVIFMAPYIPIEYTGQRELKKFLKTDSVAMMGKTRKVSKGYSSGFVPYYRHAVETMAESEGFGYSGRVDHEFITLHNPCGTSRKCYSFNVDDRDGSAVPVQLFSISEMSTVDKKDLRARLMGELERVRKIQNKIASFSFDAVRQPSGANALGYQDGQKRPLNMDGLRLNDIPMPSGKKKCPPGKNGLHSGKVGALAARKNDSVSHGLPQAGSYVMLIKQCGSLLSRLMGHQQAWIFNKPVDIVEHKIPDYFNVVKHPMDLGTVRSKLHSNQYSNPFEFAADVRLTFNNAMTYNPPRHDVYVMADTMSKFFEVRWKTIEKKTPCAANESTTSKLGVNILPETACAPPVKRQKIAETNVKQEGEKHEMSDIEKQKLQLVLESLSAELPDNIIIFLKENTLNASQESEDEIEIDFCSLNDATLLTLRKLLDTYLLEKQKRKPEVKQCEIEIKNELRCRSNGDEAADDVVDIVGNDPPPISSSPPEKLDQDDAWRRGDCNSSRSTSSESGSSSNESQSSSASEHDGAGSLSLASTLKGTEDNRMAQLESSKGDENKEDLLNGWMSGTSVEHSSLREGENAPPERQVSLEKQYRAALLRSRFADIIIKAQENSIEKGDRPDPEKLKLEREELERRRREGKARLQAEVKATEEARKKAEFEAAAEAKRKRELVREAARQALQQMEKTVDINESSHFMGDLDMFGSAPYEHLESLMGEVDTEDPQNDLLGSFKFQGSSNPLEQLGLYMKNEEEENEEAGGHSNSGTSNDPEEGEID